MELKRSDNKESARKTKEIKIPNQEKALKYLTFTTRAINLGLCHYFCHYWVEL